MKAIDRIRPLRGGTLPISKNTLPSSSWLSLSLSFFLNIKFIILRKKEKIAYHFSIFRLLLLDCLTTSRLFPCLNSLWPTLSNAHKLLVWSSLPVQCTPAINKQPRIWVVRISATFHRSFSFHKNTQKEMKHN